LAERYGISPTPVREALFELESAGVVDFIHNRGAIVKPIGVREIEEIYYVRQMLECDAIRNAFGRIPRSDLDEIDQVMKGLLKESRSLRVSSDWSDRWMESDREFHGLILENCGINRLKDEIRRYFILIETVRVAIGHDFEAQVSAVEEHIRMISALREGTCEAAVSEMERHIQNTSMRVKRTMFGGVDQGS